MFGDIVKVTPSSKVVGDMAMFMVTKSESGRCICKGWIFPSRNLWYVPSGDLGQPYGGWPEELKKLILKDEKLIQIYRMLICNLSNLKRIWTVPIVKFDHYQSFLDFLSWKFYPKVFWGILRIPETIRRIVCFANPVFFYPMKGNEEILVNIGTGKTLLIRLLYVSEQADDDGTVPVFFRLNGQTFYRSERQER